MSEIFTITIMTMCTDVLGLLKKLLKYIKVSDDILIIHSSEDRCGILEDILCKVHNISPLRVRLRFVYVPKVGYPEAYLSRVLELAKYDWILILDEDEDPAPEFFEILGSTLINIMNSICGIAVQRIDPYFFKGHKQKLVKIFRKDCITPLGLIHWWFAIKPKLLDLTSKMRIIHETKDLTLAKRIKSLKRYAYIDVFQIGLKVLYKLGVIRINDHALKIDGERISIGNSKLTKTFIKLTRVFGIRTLLAYSAFMWIVMIMLASMLKIVKDHLPFETKLKLFSEQVVQMLLYFITLIKVFRKAINIWILLYKTKSFIELFNVCKQVLRPEYDWSKNYDALLECLSMLRPRPRLR